MTARLPFEQANIRDFVDSLPDKLDTMIGEGGVRPSTGQRQRLALARVFLKNPPILILDEATSGLDSEMENLIHDAVRRLMKGRTSFLIAHRLASAVDADVIVVLDGGRIVEVGSHSELVKRAGVYSQLFNEQTRKLRINSSARAESAKQIKRYLVTWTELCLNAGHRVASQLADGSIPHVKGELGKRSAVPQPRGHESLADTSSRLP